MSLSSELLLRLRAELGPRHAAVLVALRDRACPDGLKEQQLRHNVDYLLQQEGLAEIPEDVFLGILATLRDDVRCIAKNDADQWCLRSKVRFRV